MKIRTVHFGELEIAQTDVIEFQHGPIPFVTLRRYVLLSRDDELPFQWLQSVEVPHLAMLTIPLSVAFPDFKAEIGPEDRQWLGLREGEEPVWLVVVVIGETPEQSTANLLAPIAVNFRTMRAKQVVQELDTSWARRPLLATEVRRQYINHKDEQPAKAV